MFSLDIQENRLFRSNPLGSNSYTGGTVEYKKELNVMVIRTCLNMTNPEIR